MQSYVETLKKYAVFSGRARRREYWIFFLFNIVLSVVVGRIEGLSGLQWGTSGFGPLSVLFALGLFLPGLAVTVRRLHDTDRSGWWTLVPLVPIVYLLGDSRVGANQYGGNPKGITA